MLCISWYQICQIEFLPEIQKSTFAMSISSSHPFSGNSITLAYEPPKECWVLNDPSLNRNTSKWKTLKFPNLETFQGPHRGHPNGACGGCCMSKNTLRGQVSNVTFLKSISHSEMLKEKAMAKVHKSEKSKKT